MKRHEDKRVEGSGRRVLVCTAGSRRGDKVGDGAAQLPRFHETVDEHLSSTSRGAGVLKMGKGAGCE